MLSSSLNVQALIGGFAITFVCIRCSVSQIFIRPQLNFSESAAIALDSLCYACRKRVLWTPCGPIQSQESTAQELIGLC